MARVGLEKIERLRKKVLGEWAEEVRKTVPIAIENLSEEPDVDPRLSVGYIFNAKDDRYTLQIRVQTDTGPAYERADKARAMAEREGTTADIVVVEHAQMPTLKEVEATPAHPEMRGPKEELHIGLSVGHADGRPGTLGAFVDCREGRGLLSCSHVLARSGKAEPGDWIHHPGKPDVEELSGRTRVGRLTEDFIEFSCRGMNRLDAAIAVLKETVHDQGNVLPDGCGCPVAGQHLTQVIDPAELPLGTRIGKIGRTTGYSEGTLTAVSLSLVRIQNSVTRCALPFTDIIEVTWDPERVYSAPGDSGAILFTLDPVRAVGIHFAGNKRKDGVGLSYACSLTAVLTHFHAGLVG